MLLGTGDDIARIDASDATYRLWIGDADAADADFSVTKAGVLYASGATIAGTITATAGEIGGWTVTSTELHNTDIWLDAAAKQIAINDQTFGNAGFQVEMHSGAPRFYIGDGTDKYLKYEGGVLTLNDAIIASVPSQSELSIQGWQFDGTFSATDADTVAWTSGTLTFLSGDSFSIDAGNTGNMSATTYIYFSKSDSETALQTSTTASDAVGANKVLLAVAQDSTSEALFQVYGGSGGVLISGDDIEANSITANAIAAGTITASEIAANTITANELAANTITAGEIASGTITTTEIAANTITASDIAASTITATELNVSTLSAISADMGTLTAGQVQLLSSGTIGGGNATGLVIDDNLSYDGDTWHLLTIDNGDWQIGIGTDGRLYAGGNDVYLDSTGLRFLHGSGSSNSIIWMNSTMEAAAIYASYISPNNTMKLRSGEVPPGINGIIEFEAAGLSSGSTPYSTTIKLYAGADGTTYVAIDKYLRVGYGIYVGATNTNPDLDDIHYEGDLRPVRSSTTYTGYVFVPIKDGSTNESYNGDTVSSDQTIDLQSGWSTNIPSDAVAVVVRMTWKSASAGTYAALKARSSSNTALYVHTQVADDWIDGSGIVPTHGGDIYLDVEASGELWIQIFGYFI
ncbi:MAG: hypothetical protein GF350_16815 [Chitinivibrionales bacterium]|nr:hypothetical protein [Chitinivibrionales bacterium]